GGGKSPAFSDLRPTIERRLGPIDTAFTERPGHASTLAARAAAEGREIIVAVGGDGTISDVASGILESGKPARLGIVGQGTGGDFRKTLGLEHRLDRYLDA